jgi:hypothetical protein
MLVDYINQEYPNAQDDPSPPKLIPRQSYHQIFLPAVMKPY